jgi:hypothetical protein
MIYSNTGGTTSPLGISVKGGHRQAHNSTAVTQSMDFNVQQSINEYKTNTQRMVVLSNLPKNDRNTSVDFPNIKKQ